jgi:hypothetical protein
VAEGGGLLSRSGCCLAVSSNPFVVASVGIFEADWMLLSLRIPHRYFRPGANSGANFRTLVFVRSLPSRTQLGPNGRGAPSWPTKRPNARSRCQPPRRRTHRRITGAGPCAPSRLRLWASCLQPGLRAWLRLPRIFAIRSQVGRQNTCGGWSESIPWKRVAER